ncbi:hypothetical protein NDA18_006233 [Ustilago nuda]|nr:hypothetical protein NDA18_006233 [Ustilago nuda]
MLRSNSAKTLGLARFDRLTTSSTIPSHARAYSTPSGPKKNHPSPVGFAVIALAAFGAFAYISRLRHEDPQKHLREKRIPHPNPLIPPRSQEPL